MILTWVGVIWLTKYSSLAAIVTVSLAPLYTWFIKPIYVVPVTMLAALIVFRHRDNIVRLLQGKEPKVTHKKAD